MTPSPQQSTIHPFQSSSGHVAPEMECLLTDMLMAWYQSGYTTGRYYSMLEQQQQQMNQWYAYYHQQANPSSQSPPQAYHPSQQQSDSFGKS